MFAFLGNIGFGEIVVIAIVGLILFGERLPEVAKSLGKNLSDLNKSLKETKDSISNPALDLPEAGKDLERNIADIKQSMQETKDAILNPTQDEPFIDKAPKLENPAEDTNKEIYPAPPPDDKNNATNQ